MAKKMAIGTIELMVWSALVWVLLTGISKMFLDISDMVR